MQTHDVLKEFISSALSLVWSRVAAPLLFLSKSSPVFGFWCHYEFLLKSSRISWTVAASMSGAEGVKMVLELFFAEKQGGDAFKVLMVLNKAASFYKELKELEELLLAKI